MHKRIGLIAGGAAVTLAAITGCTSAARSSGASTSGGSAAGGSNPVQLTPVALIQAALSKASNDKTVHVTGTISIPQGSGTIDAQEQFSPSVAMSMNMSLSGMNVSEILVGDMIYLKVPQLSSMLGGKAWAELNLTTLGSLGSSVQSLIDSAKNTDPTAQLQPLLASGDVHKVGTETVDGVQADHYSGTVDPATAFESSQAAKNLTSAQIAQLKSMLQAGGVTKETVDVWVASDGLPVREQITANGNSGATKVDMHLSGWGTPVSIAAPPADQVTDLSSLMGAPSATSS